MTKIKNKYVGSSPMKFLQFVPIALQLGSSIYGAIQGGRQRREARARADVYEQDFNRRLGEYEREEFVNPYANMQNVYEDMTINQRAAEFQRDQVAQQQANILEGLSGSATSGAGAAALATAMLRQGAQQARAAAVDIGQQEQAIQKIQTAERARIQGLQMQGDDMVRQQERQRNMILAQIASSRGQIANQEALAGQQQMIGGITSGLGALAKGFLPGGAISGAIEQRQHTIMDAGKAAAEALPTIESKNISSIPTGFTGVPQTLGGVTPYGQVPQIPMMNIPMPQMQQLNQYQDQYGNYISADEFYNNNPNG